MPFGKESNVRVGRSARLGTLEKMHPHQLMAYLVLAGIFFIFAVLLVVFAGAQVYTVKLTSARLPVSFIASTAVLLFSSGTIWLACRAQKAEHYKAMLAWLSFSMVMGILFFAFQLIGWNELQLQGIYLNGDAAGSYLYLISGLHLAHVLAGLLFICLVMSYAIKANLDGIGKLIYSTDKYRVLQMKLLSTYWHFMGALWVAIFLVFYLLTG